MIRTIKKDPFFDMQPPLQFLEILKSPVHKEKPGDFGMHSCDARQKAVTGKIYAGGAYLECGFPDPDGVLTTACSDFRRFLDIYGLTGDRFRISAEYGKTECFEEYRIDTGINGTKITAADTEGVRRALVWIEDEYRRQNGPYLPAGVIVRRPRIKARITRCFFSPINRPPKYGDELSDDIDYYPDEYLNRLAHDGANGVWIYSRFSDLVPSSYITEYGSGHEARIDKLNRVIRKCMRYGIKVYLFAIEPYAFTDPDMIGKYPQVLGNKASGRGRYAFCTNTEFGKAYCEEAMRRLFDSAPKLGGFIGITMGERLTACASGMPSTDCPHCGEMTLGQVLAQSVDALRAGMRSPVARDADFISWTYGHRYWDHESIREYVRHSPDDVCLQQNFEDMGYKKQLGKVRQGIDYWLSYTGPSELFRITAVEARKHSKRMFAKMQVCCSHEIASVPYIPVPGILYDKYERACRYGVDGIMQCWYFGNYPSLMSKAAGELAFVTVSYAPSGFCGVGKCGKDKFLLNLAGITWGQGKAGAVVRAWKEFEKGYSQYPLNVMFSYYGPMHDGPVWELQLKPKNFSLPRTWQTLDPTDGDRIGEAMMNGHTLEEALTLVKRMARYWRKGVAAIEAAATAGSAGSGSGSEDNEDIAEQISIARTLLVLTESGRNILEFYKLRDDIGRMSALDFYADNNRQRLQERGCNINEYMKCLIRMKGIVFSEIKNSRELSVLCRNDLRLGYHSEGEGFKFFPAKLEHRIRQLESLIVTEFPEVEERINAGLPPLEYYCGVEEGAKHCRMEGEAGKVGSSWEVLSDGSSAFRAAYDSDNIYFILFSPARHSFILTAEFRLMWPEQTMIISPDGGVKLGGTARLHGSVFGSEEVRILSAWKAEDARRAPTVGHFGEINLPGGIDGGASTKKRDYTCLFVTVDRKGAGWVENVPFKLRIATSGGALWCIEKDPVRTLGKPEMSPGEFGFIMP